MNANADKTRCGSKASATRKNYCPTYRVRKRIKGDVKESLRLSHVNMHVKVTSVCACTSVV